MKLVTNFSSTYDAERASSLLEENGIATFVSSKRSIRIPLSRGGASAVGLWAVLDTQLWDAQQLLKNPNHKVEQKLSAAEINRLRQSVHSSDMSSLLKFLFTLLGLVALFAVVVFAVIQT